MTALEDALPSFDFETRHSRWVNAAPDSVWSALTALRMQDLTLTRPLMSIRHIVGTSPLGDERLVENGPVSMFELDPPRYAVGGTIARSWQLRPERVAVTSLEQFTTFDEPGWATFLTDFSLDPRGGGVQVTTVTRGRCTDDRARRRFALYWALIRVPSALIRQDMLTAICRAARRLDVSDRECPPG